VPFVPTPHVAASSLFGSIYPSVQNLLLAARAIGLGACVVTLPLWSATSARKILGLPLSVTPCCIVPLGWLRAYDPQTGRAGDTPRRIRQPSVARHLIPLAPTTTEGREALIPG
jgi:nitroreductase